MAKRIFIAINLPEKVKKTLADYRIQYSHIPARWTKPENLHITLVFLGYIRDENLPEVFQKTEEIVQRHSSFEIKFKKITFGPLDKKPPRMIWAVGEKNKPLANLQKDLENILLSGSNNQNIDKYLSSLKNKQETKEKNFIPHITLARLKQMEFRRMEETPEINEDIDINIFVDSIEIMESYLKKSGPEYIILKSISF